MSNPDAIGTSFLIVLPTEENSLFHCKHDKVKIRQVSFIMDRKRQNAPAIGMFCSECSSLVRWIEPGEESYDWDNEQLTVGDPREV